VKKHIAVFGAGPAGIAASSALADLGYEVSLIEEKDMAGGHLQQWDRLFPEKRPAVKVLEEMFGRLHTSTKLLLNDSAEKIECSGGFDIRLRSGSSLHSDALLIATGFEPFDAHRKEEYGYGIYDHVITSVDLEDWFKSGSEKIGATGTSPHKIGIVHCVGSRDEKVGHLHCSKVCCVTAVKQAIELKEKFPHAEVYCFYMDLRMFGPGYEELYKESQEKHAVQFIRGRLSEAFEKPDGTVLVKIEDTLVGKPLKISLDLLVLMVGMLPSEGTTKMARILDLPLNSNGFLQATDAMTAPHDTPQQGVFVAGSCRAPKNLEDTFADARSAALRIDQYLSGK